MHVNLLSTAVYNDGLEKKITLLTLGLIYVDSCIEDDKRKNWNDVKVKIQNPLLQ